MFRRILIVIFTLAAMATIPLWIASHSIINKQAARYEMEIHGITFKRKFQDGNIGIMFSEGIASVLLTTTLDNTKSSKKIFHSFGGFAILVFPQTFQPKGRFLIQCISFPMWFVLVAFAAYPMTAFIRGPVRRYRRRKKGLCLKCGYLLTGNVSGICSECGEKI